jgi:TonB family protein
VLRNGRFYRWNRFYIVSSVGLSIVIPLLNITLSTPHIVMPAISGYMIHIAVDPDAVAQTRLPSIPWAMTGWIFFISTVLFLLGKEVFALVRILRLKRRSERIRIPEAVLYCTDDDAAPFTFFRSIFWKKDISVDSGEGRCILRHELAHVRLGHSWDKALMQLVCCLFWMNPFFMLFRRELELVHEFAADSESIGEGNTEELSSLILCTLYPKYYRDFTSRFFQSNVKRRIFMISKNKTKKSLNMLRMMSIVPVTLVALYLFGCNSDNTTTVSQPLSESAWQSSWKSMNDMEASVVVTSLLKEDVTLNKDVTVMHDSERKRARGAVSYDEVEQKPVFQEKENDFRRYLARNLNYPVDAQSNGIAGTVVVSFVVDKDGKVTDVKSPVRIDLLSTELERVLQSSPAWKPGKQGGKDVAVQCYAFVEFRLNTPPPKEDEDIFMIVEDMPMFDGKPVEKAFRDWVNQHTNYPAEAQENDISGRVIVEFTIDTDGSLVNAKVMRGVDPLLDAEALRVISSSPRWTPGKQRGKIVKVKYFFPVVFRLNI